MPRDLGNRDPSVLDTVYRCCYVGPTIAALAPLETPPVYPFLLGAGTREHPRPRSASAGLWLRQFHQLLQELVADLTDIQLAWAPTPGAHSMGLVLWHIARCDDNYLRGHIQGRDEV